VEFKLKPVVSAQETVAEPINDAVSAVKNLVKGAAATKAVPSQKGKDSGLVKSSPAADAAKDPYALVWEGSLMFTEQELYNLQRVIDAYQQKLKGLPPSTERALTGDKFVDDLIAKIMGEEPTPDGKSSTDTPRLLLPTEAPAFHLGSILYVGPKDWRVWINGMQYTQDARYGAVEIQSVDAQRVTMLWKAKDLAYIAPNWGQSLKHLDSTSKGNITVNDKDRTVTISLRPNQTFVSRIMRIVEGKTEATKIAGSTPATTAPIMEGF
jgi:hypothetical protein